MGTQQTQLTPTEIIERDIDDCLALTADARACIDECITLLSWFDGDESDGFPFIAEPTQIRRFPAVFK